MEGVPRAEDVNKPSEGQDGETCPKRTRRVALWLPGLRGFLGWSESDEEPPQGEALVQELLKRTRAAEERAQELQDQVHEAQRKIRAEQDTNWQLRQTIRSIESERDNMSLGMKKQEAQIRQVQALAFEGIGSNSWAAGDDSTVRADLENMHSRLKSWAKKYAIGKMSDVKELAPSERDSLIQLLSCIVRFRPRAQNAMEYLEAAQMDKKSPAMCLQGLLSHHVYATIIGQPFFVLGDAREALQSVYTRLWQANEDESHIWRSKTLRLLATPLPNMPDVHSYNEFQKAICRGVASEFYASAARYLIKPSTGKDGEADTQCFTELESIMQDAGELSHRLWSRRTYLRVLSLHELKDTRFTSPSDLMKAHPLHRLYEDDNRCDGWLASVVAHPAVLGYGSSDGKDYRTSRVWMKAEVWLAEGI